MELRGIRSVKYFKQEKENTEFQQKIIWRNLQNRGKDKRKATDFYFYFFNSGSGYLNLKKDLNLWPNLEKVTYISGPYFPYISPVLLKTN